MKAPRAAIGLFVIDDSPYFRERMRRAVALSPDIELLGVAANPFQAARKLRSVLPDVLLLDVDLPEMDGLTFLERLMDQHPMPVVVCSNSQERERARPLGVAAVVDKPRVEPAEWRMVLEAVRSAPQRWSRRAPRRGENGEDRAKNSPDVLLPKFDLRRVYRGRTDPLIVIGASTGGTEALEVVLAEFPSDAPATAVVQHMPGGFTRQFAARLDAVCKVRVAEAAKGTRLLPGRVVIAPGHAHLVIRRAGTAYFCELRNGPAISRHKPSVDILLRSAALAGGDNVVGAILTGMGSDGAIGLAELRRSGASTIAQDERSSAVFGMPKEAIAAGGVERILPLGDIAGHLLEKARGRRIRGPCDR